MKDLAVMNSTFDGCEWDPEKSRPATDADEHYRTTPARVIVGADGQWRLCTECAALPHFKRFKKRTEIPADRVMVVGRVNRPTPR